MTDLRVTSDFAEDLYKRGKARTRKTKAKMIEQSGMFSSNATALQIIDAIRTIRIERDAITGISNATGIDAAAKLVEGDPTYDAADAYATVIGLMNAAIAVAEANNVTLLLEDWDTETNNVVQWKVFTPAQTASFKTAIDAIIAALV